MHRCELRGNRKPEKGILCGIICGEGHGQRRSDCRARTCGAEPQLAVGLSFLGMLVYIGFRFKPIYGVGAIVACSMIWLVTLGLFAVTQKEISLTVIAALLTLVGYSVNDTIVVFDRARENLRLQRKESIYRFDNLSINQTLSRTIMTCGCNVSLSVCTLCIWWGSAERLFVCVNGRHYHRYLLVDCNCVADSRMVVPHGRSESQAKTGLILDRQNIFSGDLLQSHLKSPKRLRIRRIRVKTS